MVTGDIVECFREGPVAGWRKARFVCCVHWLVTSNYTYPRVPHRHPETLTWILAPSSLPTQGNFLIPEKKIIQGNEPETLLL